ncbi:hypothetical protein N7471_000288 [Penicillium samsonianum]|uniref:uncharacterized protein n=1 Tax=Penicillium samsonianum TaxID=1882272 RepID=UPI002549839B|nr:uncharacterized protein N7471_000288 [Penicillium samsonianum]KAJ6149089.1 hypothetical protein N7471_000288 [Penicillium samsonianum]
MLGYECLDSNSPRSFLFSVVANVGPRGASRSLGVAYRQGNDRDAFASSQARVENVVADTLALIEILSDPMNRAPLEAERALAEGWYRRSQGGNETESTKRPTIPDTPQPPFIVPDGSWRREQPQILPELPWHDDALSEFPFIATCLLLGLLRDDGDIDDGDSDANATYSNSTRPGDIQLQPLSTIFRGDCTEYGLVVLDISDLDSGVKYGIVGFPVCYMAEVTFYCKEGGWDPVEDPPPKKEPDIILISPRPRVPLSILQWLRKYFYYISLQENPRFLRLEDRPLIDTTALDYIWPPELESQARVENQAREPSQGVISSISDYFWPLKSTTSAKDISTITASRLTTSHEPPRNAHMDRAIDNLLILTQEPADLHLDEETISRFQKLAEFREQLRRRLEEVPDSLGPSSEASGHILRVAYAGNTHLNWVVFRNLAPSVIATAIISDELRGASALSLCVDKFKLEGGEGGLGDLVATLAECTTLKQLCFVQGPDRNSDDTSARFYTQLLLRGRSSGNLGWLRDKTIYPTYAFSRSLRNHKFASPSTTSVTFTSSVVQVFPVMHMFTFVGHQREDVADADHQNSHYYDMGNTLLDPERFAVQFLSYLRSVGSGSDKAILRFAYGEASSSVATTTTNNDKSPLPSSSSGGFAVSPIPAGFFGNRLAANYESRVRVRDIHPGSWVLLLDQKGRSSSDDGDDFLQYSFVRIRQTSDEIAPEQQQKRPIPVPAPDLVEVVGGLTEFLRETVPGSDISTWEKRVEEAEKDFRARRASIETGKRCIGIGVMAESSARALLDQLL